MEATNSDIAKWRTLFARLFDRHTAQMALLDLQGIILETNAAWRSFGRENGLPTSYDCIGMNYLEAWEAAAAANQPGAREAYLGLMEVIHTHRLKFTMVYPCNSPAEKRLFRMWVEPQMPSAPVIIVAHYQISTQPVGSSDDPGPSDAAEGADLFKLFSGVENAVTGASRKTIN